MSIRELKTLLAVAEHGSLSAAAERTFLSLPAASAQIARLEAEFKTVLLDRARKPARLTAQGQALVARSRELVAQYSRLYEAVSSPHDLTGTLNIGAIPTALTGVLPRALLALRKAHPRVHVRLEHGLSPSLADRLLHRELDAAIVSEPRAPLPGIRWNAFAREPIVVIAPAGLPRQSDESLLRNHPYLRFNRHFWVSRFIEENLRRRKIHLQETMELDSLEAIGQMVRYGLGVSIIPLSNRSFLRLHGLQAVPLGRPGMTRAIGLAEPVDSGKSQLTSAFMTCLLRAGSRSRPPVGE